MKNKQLATWNTCRGEAHNNPFIDNCMVCMPYWHYYPTCPVDNKKLLQSGYCRDCKKYYDISEKEVKHE